MSTIRLENVAKYYKTKDRRLTAAVQSTSLRIAQGEFVFLVGSRGAGKSTLLSMICGRVRPDRGAAYLDNVNLARLPMSERKRIPEFIGYVPEQSSIRRKETVRSNLFRRGLLDFWWKRRVDEALAEKALSLVGMSGALDLPARELTGSQCRRVEVARAILHSPDILLLDEVTEQVDNDTVWDLIHLFTELNARGTTIVMATSASRIVNAMRRRVVTLSDGKIAADVPKGRFGEVPKLPPALAIRLMGGGG